MVKTPESIDLKHQKFALSLLGLKLPCYLNFSSSIFIQYHLPHVDTDLASDITPSICYDTRVNPDS